MSTRRLFTDEELENLTKTNLQLILEAIDSGDADKAKEVVKRAHVDYQRTHDGLSDWVTDILSFIGREYGDEALYKALEEGCSGFMKPLSERATEGGPREVIESMAGMARGHFGHYAKIEEDDEKFTLYFPCPTGGRMVAEGRYDGPDGFLKLSQAQLMTYRRKQFPVYCAHCYFQDSLPIDFTGRPIWLTEPAERQGEVPCVRYVYKRPEDVPDRFYERLGKKKTAGTPSMVTS